MKKASEINIKNKKATFLYELHDKYTAGIQLYGTEIKSIREGKAGLADSYCYMENNELWVKMHIAEYDYGTYNNHDPRRERKLLLTKKELRKISAKILVKGFTVIPIALYINENGYAKLDISLARGKKQFDKRDDIKEKDVKREMDRKMKY